MIVMFDNTHKVSVDAVDDRVLPAKGLINLWRLVNFLGYSVHYDKYKHDQYLDLLVVELEKHKIPIFKVGSSASLWFVRLEDIKPGAI